MVPRTALIAATLLLSACQTSPETRQAPLAEVASADTQAGEMPVVPTSSPTPPAAVPPFAQTPIPASWTIVDPSQFNAQIDSAVSAGDQWPHSPVMATLHLLGGDEETRVVTLEAEKNRGEDADSTTVVYVRDGFLDDSVRGDWYEILYLRQSDETWRVSEVRVAYRCWRGENTETYRAELCP